ncbi:MAG: type II toxin-antitoxin system RelE/ParE family toxin [Vulcanimicrobiaceae bacterium]
MRLSERAERDLEEVALWFVERHPSGKQRFFDKFAELIEMLARFPYAGREHADLSIGLHSWVVHPYRVYHVVDGKQRTVMLKRVLHGSMDFDEDDFEN